MESVTVRKFLNWWEVYFPVALRLTLGGLLFFGHGLPKVSILAFNIPLWGAFVERPTSINVPNVVGAVIEFVAPLMMICGYRIRLASATIGLMLLSSVVFRSRPIFHSIFRGLDPDHPVLYSPSQDLLTFMACAFLATAYIGRGSETRSR